MELEHWGGFLRGQNFKIELDHLNIYHHEVAFAYHQDLEYICLTCSYISGILFICVHTFQMSNKPSFKHKP